MEGRTNLEAIWQRATRDPLAQRHIVAIKGIVAESETIEANSFKDADLTRGVQDAVLSICQRIHDAAYRGMAIEFAKGSYAGQGPLMPDSPMQLVIEQRQRAEHERDKAIRRAEEAETRLDELRRVVGPPPRDYVGGPLLDASTLVKGSGGGDNGTSDREV